MALSIVKVWEATKAGHKSIRLIKYKLLNEYKSIELLFFRTFFVCLILPNYYLTAILCGCPIND